MRCYDEINSDHPNAVLLFKTDIEKTNSSYGHYSSYSFWALECDSCGFLQGRYCSENFSDEYDDRYSTKTPNEGYDNILEYGSCSEKCRSKYVVDQKREALLMAIYI